MAVRHWCASETFERTINSIQQLVRGEKRQSNGGEVANSKGCGQHNFERYSLTTFRLTLILMLPCTTLSQLFVTGGERV